MTPPARRALSLLCCESHVVAFICNQRTKSSSRAHKMVLSFRGVAHPPAASKRSNVADSSSAEIHTQKLGGLPLHVEHDTSAAPVGRVQASWKGRQGDLRVLARVDDPDTERKIRNGSMRGLSLGTEVVQSMDGSVLRRAQCELSVCEEPRRLGCFIDEIEGRTVHTSERFSKRTTAPLAQRHLRMR